MLFCLLVNEEGRVILDDEPHGDVLVVIEAKSWQAARYQALKQKEMDPFSYRAGFARS